MQKGHERKIWNFLYIPKLRQLYQLFHFIGANIVICYDSIKEPLIRAWS